MHRESDDERPFDVPVDRHYDGSRHLWAQRDEGSGRVRVGIDSIGLESLGELAYVALRPSGSTVARGESLGTLEAAKMPSDIAAPVSGTIAGRNDAVLRDPLLVNEDPYGAGWLVEIEPSSWKAEARDLISGAAIAGWAAAEIRRLDAETPAD
jgi:glycine cleavage system H protein